MVIRLATAMDRDEVLALLDEILVEVNKKSKIPAQPSESQERRENMFLELLNRPDVKIFVAEENSKLIGAADLFVLPIMRRGYYQGHVEDLVITERARGKGVGSMIMRTIKDYCKQSGIKVVKLTSAFELEDAHKFYEKQGGVHTEKMFRFDLKD